MRKVVSLQIPAQAGALLVPLVLLLLALTASAGAEGISRQVLGFYYGWYGNRATSGQWVHWQGVDPANERIANSTDFPALGAYDSHDPAIIERQVAGSARRRHHRVYRELVGRRQLHGSRDAAAACRSGHGLAVSAYYEKVAGDDAASRIKAAVADLDYLLTHYGTDKAWLRVGKKPVLFVYGRALHELSPADWQEVIAQVRRDNPGGVVLIADSLDRAFVSMFDGASTYNITGQTQHKSPAEIRAWAQAAYPKMVAAAARKDIDRDHHPRLRRPRDGTAAAAPGDRPLGRRDLPGAVAGGDRRGAGLGVDHLMERVARGQRDRSLGRVWVAYPRQDGGVLASVPCRT